jgi:hypothetical protein
LAIKFAGQFTVLYRKHTGCHYMDSAGEITAASLLIPENALSNSSEWTM